jgi:ABC-type amino acid transport substrate-binding protein
MRLLIGLLMLAFLPRWALADDVVRPIEAEHLPWAISGYELALLHGALERTRPDYGAYEVKPFTENVSNARAIQLAIGGDLVNLYPAGVGQAVPEREMIPVPFPIDKGLLSYRVSLINQHNQDRFSRVQSIEDLRQLSVGQGSGWADTRIYEYNRIPIEPAPNFESLFPMLLNGRFDLFPRGLSAYSRRFPGFAIEQHILIHYPFCKVFYISRSAPRLATRLAAGLERMVADGSFDALFAKYFSKLLVDLHLRQRVVIELENPSLPAWVPLKRKELWFDPRRLP